MWRSKQIRSFLFYSFLLPLSRLLYYMYITFSISTDWKFRKEILIERSIRPDGDLGRRGISLPLGKLTNLRVHARSMRFGSIPLFVTGEATLKQRSRVIPFATPFPPPFASLFLCLSPSARLITKFQEIRRTMPLWAAITSGSAISLLTRVCV